MGEHAPIRMKDLAKQLGVSASTVSLVLSGRGDENRIARETQERVFQAAEAMNYRPRKAPKAPPKSRFFGIFLPADIVQGPVSQVFNGIADYRRETGSEDEFLMVTYDHAGLARKKHLLSRGSPFSAAILVGTQEADVAFLRGFQAEIPIAVLNRDVPGCYCVLIDDYEVGRSAAEHFLRRGHRQLGLIAPRYTSKSLGLRVSGFLDYLQDHRQDLDALPTLSRGENSPTGGQTAMEELLQSCPQVSSVFIANDSMVTGAVRAIRDAGRHIPEDVEIISFGNMDVNRWSDPPVTSFAYPVEEMFCDALDILARSLADPTGKPFSRHYAAECVYRTSCPREGRFLPRRNAP